MRNQRTPKRVADLTVTLHQQRPRFDLCFADAGRYIIEHDDWVSAHAMQSSHMTWTGRHRLTVRARSHDTVRFAARDPPHANVYPIPVRVLRCAIRLIGDLPDNVSIVGMSGHLLTRAAHVCVGLEFHPPTANLPHWLVAPPSFFERCGRECLAYLQRLLLREAPRNTGRPTMPTIVVQSTHKTTCNDKVLLLHEANVPILARSMRQFPRALRDLAYWLARCMWPDDGPAGSPLAYWTAMCALRASLGLREATLCLHEDIERSDYGRERGSIAAAMRAANCDTGPSVGLFDATVISKCAPALARADCQKMQEPTAIDVTIRLPRAEHIQLVCVEAVCSCAWDGCLLFEIREVSRTLVARLDIRGGRGKFDHICSGRLTKPQRARERRNPDPPLLQFMLVDWAAQHLGRVRVREPLEHSYAKMCNPALSLWARAMAIESVCLSYDQTLDFLDEGVRLHQSLDRARATGRTVILHALAEGVPQKVSRMRLLFQGLMQDRGQPRLAVRLAVRTLTQLAVQRRRYAALRRTINKRPVYEMIGDARIDERGVFLWMLGLLYGQRFRAWRCWPVPCPISEATCELLENLPALCDTPDKARVVDRVVLALAHAAREPGHAPDRDVLRALDRCAKRVGEPLGSAWPTWCEEGGVVV